MDFVENRGGECEVLAKWAAHLAPKPTLFKYTLVPEVEEKAKHLHSTGPLSRVLVSLHYFFFLRVNIENSRANKDSFLL